MERGRRNSRDRSKGTALHLVITLKSKKTLFFRILVDQLIINKRKKNNVKANVNVNVNVNGANVVAKGQTPIDMAAARGGAKE